MYRDHVRAPTTCSRAQFLYAEDVRVLETISKRVRAKTNNHSHALGIMQFIDDDDGDGDGDAPTTAATQRNFIRLHSHNVENIPWASAERKVLA